MKTRLLTLLFALTTSVGAIYGDLVVTIGDLRYILNEETMTAKVTYKHMTFFKNESYYNMNAGIAADGGYYSTCIWHIMTANIPASIEYNGKTYDVIAIGEHAFQNCKNLQSVSIPNSVTTIESYAFTSCDSLQSITMPNSVTTIESYAFYSCTTLQSITISNGLISIGKDAFVDCRNLNAVHISDIAAWCAINFNGNNPLTLAHNLYLNGDLVTDLAIPKGVTNITKEAFLDCSSITSVIFPNSVTHIDSKAFYNCSNLKTAVIGKNVIGIAQETFAGSTYLKLVTLLSDSIVSRTYTLFQSIANPSYPLFGDSVETYIIGEGIKKIGDYAFASSRNLKSVSIPNSVTSIGANAFYGCLKLSLINIPNSVSHIGPYAFQACRNLTNINLPNSITSIENGTFVSAGLISIDIPNSVTRIGRGAFGDCSKLIAVSIPNSVTSIESSAFGDCISLSSIEIPNSVTNIENGAFVACDKLESITIPNSITDLREETFYKCYNLKSVNLPDNLKTIGYKCFDSCFKLDSVKIPHNVKSIGNLAFFQCKSLTSIKLSDSLEIIGDSCFKSCYKLRSITIPSKVTSIGSQAFYNIDLKEIILLPTTPPIITGPKYYFDYAHKCAYPETSIYVPCGTLEAYMATNWSLHNIQYQPNIYNINAFAVDTLRGKVDVENNSCLTYILATPYVGNYFVKWSDGSTENPRTITLTQDTTITAIFATQTFTVIFVDDNDTVLSSQEYEYGSLPIPPTDPVKTNDAQYSYTFAGWSPRIVAVTRDATYKATYTSTLNKYTITFMSEDSVLSTDLWEYGTTPVYRGGTPTKAEDGEYVYTFNGWIPEIVSVVADATYTATFTATPKPEAIEDVMDNSIMPTKHVENGKIYILMPNGKKYSIIGELVK